MLTNEQREEVIEGLIANCDCWAEDDRETLNSFDDDKLEFLLVGNFASDDEDDDS